MTIEFADEPDDVAAPPRPGPAVRARWAVPWLVPVVLLVVALLVPVTLTRLPNPTAGTASATGASLRVELYPFGRYTLNGIRVGTSGPAYGWLWLVLLVGFLATAGWSAARPASTCPAVVGAVISGVGVGSIATLLFSIRASGSSRAGVALGAGAWLAVAAGVVGLVLGLTTFALRQSASAKAGG